MKKKVMILALILIILTVLSAPLGFMRCMSVGDATLLKVGDTEFRSLWEGISFEPTENGAEFTIDLHHLETTAQLVREGEHITITYADGEVVEGDWPGVGYLLDEDGSPLFFGQNMVTIVVGDEPAPPINRVSLSDDLCSMLYGDTEPAGHFGLTLVGMLVYALGAVTFFYPEEMHFLFIRWKYRNTELSDDGILVEKISAVVLMVGAGIIMLLPVFMLI